MNVLALVLIAPLLAALLILVLRRRVEVIAFAGAATSLVAASDLLIRAVQGRAAVRLLLPGLPDMPLRLEATPLTSVLSAVVATVATMVLLYAVGYMRKDAERPRFFATMLLFVAAMQALVLSGDWITLLGAWELIGVSSYLLIGFWHARPGVAQAATRAFLYTRSADLGLYLGAFLLIGTAGTSEISVSLATTGGAATVAGLLLLVAAIGKSAQVPMQDWLQRAMAGPTPVSALLHSATLVAAGAILLIRVAPMLPAGTLVLVGLVGGVTTVITGLIALAERDLKRLLAASTSSQYGLMLLAIGAGAPVVALLHLIAHAAIKSGLFLGAGVFQHERGTTSMDGLTGAGRDHPRIFAGFAIAALALAGIPPLAGFFSKDAIIAATISAPGAVWLLPLGLAGTVLTGAYMARALTTLWQGPPRAAASGAGLHWMGVGMGVLVALAAVLGAGFPALERLLGAEISTSGWAMLLGLGAALSGLLLGWRLSPRDLLGPLLGWAQGGFVIAGGMDALVLRPMLAVARICNSVETWLYEMVFAVGRGAMRIGRITRISDEAGIDGAIFGLARATTDTGQRARRLQSGLIHRELALTIVGTGIIAAALFAAPLFY
jgi:NADH-quinone oxidoreductase subunit L